MTITDDDFQHWLAHMDDALEEFFAMLPANVRDRLDCSIDALDVLEAWLLERYPRLEDTRRKEEVLPLDGAARYIGETFRKTVHARWAMGSEGGLWEGMVVVTNFRTGPGEDCPLSMATASTDRRCGDYISSILRKQLDILSGKRKRLDGLLPAAKRFKIKTIEEEDFDYWLSLMDRALGELFEELPEHVRHKLDFSPASLDVLESWLLARYPDGDATRAETEVVRLDGVARYLGETFRRNVGGEWWFDLDGWTHDGLPQIAGIADGMPPVCPLALVREAAAFRCKDLFTRVLQSYQASPAAHAERAGQAGKN